MEYVALGARSLIATVLVVATVAKVRDLAGLAQTLLGWRLLPPSLTGQVATAVVTVEGGLALALVVARGAFLTAALVISSVFFTALATTIGFVLRRGTIGASCACFGSRPSRLGRRHIWRNLVLAGAGLVGAAGVGTSAHTVSPGGAVIALTVGLVGAIVVVTLDALVGIVNPSPRALHSPST